eukprot:scaffold7266_cov71-Cylindrotheca_fusiformis.AAC.1
MTSDKKVSDGSVSYPGSFFGGIRDNSCHCSTNPARMRCPTTLLGVSRRRGRSRNSECVMF